MTFDELGAILRGESGNGRFAIISAPDERFADLVVELTKLAQDCNHIGPLVILNGRYEGVDEKSVLVPGLGDFIAQVFGSDYNQECIFHSERGFVYCDEGYKQDPSRDVKRTYDDTITCFPRWTQPTPNDYENSSTAKVSEGLVVFTFGLDFS